MKQGLPQERSGYPRPEPRLAFPWWVGISIWGSGSRKMVMGWVWTCLGIGVVFFAAGFLYRPAFLIVPVAWAGALPYWLSVKWLDRYNGWEQVRQKHPWKL